MSKIGHSIKKRSKANDVFITPLELAKNHIQMIEYEESDIWYDPFKNSGNYYNQFPNDNKVWSEILEGEDFFDFNMDGFILVDTQEEALDAIKTLSFDLYESKIEAVKENHSKAQKYVDSVSYSYNKYINIIKYY